MPSGEPSANEEFLREFVAHEDALRAYARSLLPNWQVVDEVLQESSVVMWQKYHQLTSADGFLPWAKVIVRFEALKARRSAARDKLWFSEEVMELISDEDSDSESADSLDKEREALEQCLAKLSDRQRELVMLPYRDHGAITRLAEETKKSVNSYYKKIGRIRQNLSNCIDGELEGREAS